jgi:hypothetical protein
MLHEHISCFKLIVFLYLVPHTWFWCFNVFLYSFLVQTYFCMIFWLVGIKKEETCFRSKKYQFLGLVEATLARNFSGFLSNVLRVIEKNIILVPIFEPILVHFFTHNPFLCMINTLTCFFLNVVWIL